MARHALPGAESRPHGDLDLVIAAPDCQAAPAPLGYGYDPAVRPGLPARLVLRTRDARQVDVHPVRFDPAGDGWQDLGHGIRGGYPAAGLAGRGTIGGRPVRCLTAELQLRHRLGYEPDDGDRHDMRLPDRRSRPSGA